MSRKTIETIERDEESLKWLEFTPMAKLNPVRGHLSAS